MLLNCSRHSLNRKLLADIIGQALREGVHGLGAVLLAKVRRVLGT